VSKAHPLDLDGAAYAYLERVNPAILSLYARHVASRRPAPRILDVGCGCGANARALAKVSPDAYIVGIEPDPRAAELAADACTEVIRGSVEEWLRREPVEPFDVVVLSDVLEHVADPIELLRALSRTASLRAASWLISVPNYGVWYNRARTLLGMQGYSWSGLWDRTHLRFFTRASIRELLEYAGFDLLDDACSPSLVQSTAPVLRRLFDRSLSDGKHLAVADSTAYSFYRRAIEPLESSVCQAWPELLGFQIVQLARLRSRPREPSELDE